jgi:sugar phosphate isomerase/epimerase
MKPSQIAAQLYTVREFLKTPEQIADSLKKVRAIGYEAVQVSGMAPIPEEDLARMLAGAGLVCCATHEKTEVILDEPQRVVERLQTLNCPITAVPSPGPIKLETIEEVKVFAARMNAAGRVLHEAGLTLAYHNHHGEFRRLNGRTILEIIFDETDPRYLQGEPDTYWVQYGGGDPVEWCQRLKNRLPIIHLKDYCVLADRKVSFGEVGSGNLRWPAIIAAAEAAGCRWFCVEQDSCPGDPFESLKKSFDYIKENLC